MNPTISSDIILASKSPRRAEIMKKHGADFFVYVPQVDEITTCDDLQKLPEINASIKAAAAADIFSDKTVIGADTVIFFEDSIIGKPADINDAHQILKRLSGHKHQVITGCTVINRNKNINRSFSCISEVYFKNLTDADIHRYTALVHVLDKAGAYAIQEHSEIIIEKYSGSLENIIGFPWDEIYRCLISEGLAELN